MYPQNTLQTTVEWMVNGKPGEYPAQAKNDEIATAAPQSTLPIETVFKVGTAVIFDTDGYRPLVAGDANGKIDGVVVYSYQTTANPGASSYSLTGLYDTQFPIKTKGAVVVSLESLTGLQKGSELSARADGVFGLSATGNKVVAILKELYTAYQSALVELIQIPYTK